MKEEICPWCDKKIKRNKFRSHLMKEHGKTLEDYFRYLYGEDRLTCKYPGCNNQVSITTNWVIHETCCYSHQLGLLSLRGKHWYSHENRKTDEDGKDVIMKGVTERGNNPFSSKNRILDENGNDIISKKSMESKLKNGIINPITLKSGRRDVDVNKESYVYVLRSNDIGYVKVGRSIDVESRLKSLAMSVTIDEVHKFKTNEKVAADIECMIHKEFCKYICLDKSIVNYSEWYDISQFDNILEYINNYITAQRLEFNS